MIWRTLGIPQAGVEDELVDAHGDEPADGDGVEVVGGEVSAAQVLDEGVEQAEKKAGEEREQGGTAAALVEDKIEAHHGERARGMAGGEAMAGLLAGGGGLEEAGVGNGAVIAVV